VAELAVTGITPTPRRTISQQGAHMKPAGDNIRRRVQLRYLDRAPLRLGQSSIAQLAGGSCTPAPCSAIREYDASGIQLCGDGHYVAHTNHGGGCSPKYQGAVPKFALRIFTPARNSSRGPESAHVSKSPGECGNLVEPTRDCRWLCRLH